MQIFKKPIFSFIKIREKAKNLKEAHGEIETHHPGYLGSQDTYYVGYSKGVGKIYQQTFVDTYSRVAIVKLYDQKTALTAADVMNDRILPFFENHDIPLLRVLTDRGTEYTQSTSRYRFLTSIFWQELSRKT